MNGRQQNSTRTKRNKSASNTILTINKTKPGQINNYQTRKYRADQLGKLSNNLQTQKQNNDAMTRQKLNKLD